MSLARWCLKRDIRSKPNSEKKQSCSRNSWGSLPSSSLTWARPSPRQWPLSRGPSSCRRWDPTSCTPNLLTIRRVRMRRSDSGCWKCFLRWSRILQFRNSALQLLAYTSIEPLGKCRLRSFIYHPSWLRGKYYSYGAHFHWKHKIMPSLFLNICLTQIYRFVMTCLILATKYYCETQDIVVNIDICRLMGLRSDNSSSSPTKSYQEGADLLM